MDKVGLTTGDWINIIAMAVTVICTVLSVAMFLAVDNRRKIIERKYRKLSLVDVRTTLSQIIQLGDELRIRLATGGRGQAIFLLTHPIRSALSNVFGRLPPNCEEMDLRDAVLRAQQELKSLENGTNTERIANHDKFMIALQDAVGISQQYFEAADSKEA